MRFNFCWVFLKLKRNGCIFNGFMQVLSFELTAEDCFDVGLLVFHFFTMKSLLGKFGNVQENPNLEGERCGICMDVIIDRGVLDCCQHWYVFFCFSFSPP